MADIISGTATPALYKPNQYVSQAINPTKNAIIDKTDFSSIKYMMHDIPAETKNKTDTM